MGARRAPGPVALLVTAAALLLAGCSSGAAETPTPSDTTATSLLTVDVYGPAKVVTAYAKIAADYTDQHPDTVVNIRPYASATAAVSAVRREITTGDAPDAFLAPSGAVPSLIEAEALQPVDNLLGEREIDFGDGYQRASLEAFSFDKRLQCMPVDDSPLVVYYNTDLIDLASLTPEGSDPIDPEKGWNLDQFTAAARQASRHGNRGVYVQPGLEQLAPFIWSGGGSVVDDESDPTTLRLSTGGSRSALEKVLEIVRNPALTFDEDELANEAARARFEAGHLGMILGFRDLTPQLRARTGLHFDVMPLPRLGSTVTVGQDAGLCLSATSANPGKTADFLAYAVSDEASALLARTGYVVPTNLDVANSADFTQPGLAPAAASVFTMNVRSIRSLPSVPAWPAVEAETGPLLTHLFYDAVIDPLSDRLQEIDAASVPIFTPETTPSP